MKFACMLLWIAVGLSAEEILGRVVAADTGAGLAGVIVSAVPMEKGVEPVPAVGTTDRNGDVRVNVTGGKQFRVCAALPGSEYLPTCIWGKSETAELGKLFGLTMDRGTTVRVRVYFEAKEALGERGVATVVATYKSQDILFPPVERGEGYEDYSLAVPPDPSLKLKVLSAKFEILGQDKAKLTPGSDYSIPEKSEGIGGVGVHNMFKKAPERLLVFHAKKPS